MKCCHKNFPKIGLGTWKIKGGGTEGIIKAAVGLGYRLIDTASDYGNEQFVGKEVTSCIKEGMIKREDIYLSSKLANCDQGYYNTLAAFDRTLNQLGVEYLDIYLIHWPVPKDRESDYKELNQDSWRAMEELYKKKRVQMIGVCNFLERHLENIMETAYIVPMINQLEIHPQYQERELVEYCRKNNVLVEGWGPFRHGEIFKLDELLYIARKYNKTTAQICLRWCAERGIVPLPKASTKERMKENIEIFDFELSNEDMEYMKRFDLKDRHENYWSYERQLRY